MSAGLQTINYYTKEAGMRFTVQDFLLQKGCRNAAIVVVLQTSRPYAVVVLPARFVSGYHGYCFLFFQAESSSAMAGRIWADCRHLLVLLSCSLSPHQWASI